jgi:hypothetical protein
MLMKAIEQTGQSVGRLARFEAALGR